MKVKQMVLEQVTLEEYEGLEHFWAGKERVKKPDSGYCRILNPRVYRSYSDLVRDVVDHPLARELCVRGPMGWYRIWTFGRQSIPESKVQDAAELAHRDPRKRNYLEVKLKSDYREHAFTVIGFTQFEGLIVGYEMSVLAKHREEFTIMADDGYKFYNGIWVPADFRSRWQRLSRPEARPAARLGTPDLRQLPS